MAAVVSSNPLEPTLFFVEAFKNLDVSFVLKYQICVQNEKPERGHYLPLLGKHNWDLIQLSDAVL